MAIMVVPSLAEVEDFDMLTSDYFKIRGFYLEGCYLRGRYEAKCQKNEHFLSGRAFKNGLDKKVCSRKRNAEQIDLNLPNLDPNNGIETIKEELKIKFPGYKWTVERLWTREITSPSNPPGNICVWKRTASLSGKRTVYTLWLESVNNIDISQLTPSQMINATGRLPDDKCKVEEITYTKYISACKIPIV